MRLLHVIASLNPAFGGPSEVVRQFGNATPEQSHVVCLDEAFSLWHARFKFPVTALGRPKNFYGSHSALISWLRQHAPEFDAVIAHGLWQYPTFATRAALKPLGRPYFVFPHGMLDPWFKTAYPIKHLKKLLYWRLREHSVLRDARAVLFTCEEEKLLARQTFRPCQVREAIAPLGIEPPPTHAEQQRAAFYERFPELRGKRILLFFGRLHDKKGPDLLIRAFAKLLSSVEPTTSAHGSISATPRFNNPQSDIRNSESSGPPFRNPKSEIRNSDSPIRPPQSAIRNSPEFHLLLAGPPASETYLRELQQLATEHCPPHTVSFPGMLSGDLKWGALRAADAFVLPSHQENFGIAVAEALACGTPVLISNKVNIWREIEADGAGSICQDNEGSVFATLKHWATLDLKEREIMRTKASRCFASRFEIKRAADTLTKVLAAHLDQSNPPPILQ